jgi:hypothetical protein
MSNNVLGKMGIPVSDTSSFTLTKVGDKIGWQKRQFKFNFKYIWLTYEYSNYDCRGNGEMSSHLWQQFYTKKKDGSNARGTNCPQPKWDGRLLTPSLSLKFKPICVGSSHNSPEYMSTNANRSTFFPISHNSSQVYRIRYAKTRPSSMRKWTRQKDRLFKGQWDGQ